jgi:hypothetical protein
MLNGDPEPRYGIPEPPQPPLYQFHVAPELKFPPTTENDNGEDCWQAVVGPLTEVAGLLVS